MSEDKGDRRLRAAMRAYPRQIRQAEGEVLTSLARDMVDGGQSTMNREAFGLLRGGLVKRAGTLAEAPWEDALRRISLPVAAALLAFNLGMLGFWVSLDGFVWPGWSWVVAVSAPALALFGLLVGRRLPLMVGAVLVCLLGIAEGNGLLPAMRLQGEIHWSTGGFTLGPLACAIPAGLLLFFASLGVAHRASRSTTVASLAWVAVGAIAVRLLINVNEQVGNVDFNGLAISMIAFGLAMFAMAASGFWRRHRDPVGMLAGFLGLATALPIVLLFGTSRIAFYESPLGLVMLVVTALAIAVALICVLRLTPALKR